MNSKEALERILMLARPCAYEVREHRNNYCDMLENAIKQDLDRLEQLEKENQELIRTQNVILLNSKDCILKNMELEEENQELKEAVKILKEKVEINTYYLSLIDNEDGLTVKNYELLKKVFGNG